MESMIGLGIATCLEVINYKQSIYHMFKKYIIVLNDKNNVAIYVSYSTIVGGKEIVMLHFDGIY